MAEPKIRPKVRGVFEKPADSDVWWIQYFDHGRRRRERVGTHANAVKLYQKRKTQIMTGDKLPELQRKRVTLGELIDDALDYARQHDLVMRNYEGYAKALREALGTRSAEDVKASELATWLKGKGKSGASFNRHRAFASVCYREGIRSGKVRENVARQVQQRKEPRGRQRFLSRDEYEKIVARLTVLHPEEVPLFVISVFTGMRLSEQFWLPWKGVNFERGVIELRKTKNHEDRTIPMASVVAEQFQILRDRTKSPPRGQVFPRPRGGVSRIKSPFWFDRLMAEFEIEPYTWHHNRHTFCSWLAIAGVPLKTIQELAGHKTIAITAKYAHLCPDHTRSEIEKLVAPLAPAKVLDFPSATRTAIG